MRRPVANAMGLTARLGRSALAIAIVSFVGTLFAACAVGGPNVVATRAPGGSEAEIGLEFLEFYELNGGLDTFGAPLADVYREGGRLVQYFQRLRLEYELVSGQILVTPLGEWAVPEPEYRRLASVPENSLGRYFEETGLTVQDEFLTFYEANNGELLFGLPISAQLDEGDLRVQYFENARLEWHPEAARDRRIQVGLLSKAHYRAHGFYQDPGRARPVAGIGLEEAEVSAVFKTPILYAGDEQAVYVTVETPDNRRPVADMLVALTVTYNGRTEVFELPETDGEGRTQGPISLPDADPGQKVQVVVTASVPGSGVIGATSLSYKTWW